MLICSRPLRLIVRLSSQLAEQEQQSHLRMSLQTLLSEGHSSFALVERLKDRDLSAAHAYACFAQDDISFENVTFQFFKEPMPGSLAYNFLLWCKHQKSEDLVEYYLISVEYYLISTRILLSLRLSLLASGGSEEFGNIQ